MLVLSLFCNNPDLNARCSIRVNHLELIGLYPPEKAASTGTLTRIVANKKGMEQGHFYMISIILVSNI